MARVNWLPCSPTALLSLQVITLTSVHNTLWGQLLYLPAGHLAVGFAFPLAPPPLPVPPDLTLELTPFPLAGPILCLVPESVAASVSPFSM